MEVESNNNNNNSSNNKEILLQRPGQEAMTIKLADNTGKKSETAKRRLPPKRLRFKKSLGRRNYIGGRGKQGLRNKKDARNNNKDFRNRRQRGVGMRRRGLKIIVRGLTRNVTNQDIKYNFEKIGPLKRCGINYNNLGESKGTAEVEYYYRKDAFTACRKLDYKNIRGVPIRLEIRDGLRRIFPRSIGRRTGDNRRSRSFGGARRFREQRSFRRDSSSRRRNVSAPGRSNSNRRGIRRSIRKRMSASGRRGERRGEDRRKNFKN